MLKKILNKYTYYPYLRLNLRIAFMIFLLSIVISIMQYAVHILVFHEFNINEIKFDHRLTEFFVVNTTILFLLMAIFLVFFSKKISVILYNNLEIENQKKVNLKSRLQPHFIFNALNTISYYCRVNDKIARNLVLELSNYLRSSLEDYRHMIPLKKELEYINSYIFIEKYRFEERVNIDIKAVNKDILIPSFTLKPLVENAIKHGALSRKEGGQVTLRVIEENNGIRITVEDNGRGMDKEKIREFLKAKDKNFTSLSSVNRRVKLIYGKELEIESNVGKGTKISIFIPI